MNQLVPDETLQSVERLFRVVLESVCKRGITGIYFPFVGMFSIHFDNSHFIRGWLILNLPEQFWRV